MTRSYRIPFLALATLVVALVSLAFRCAAAPAPAPRTRPPGPRRPTPSRPDSGRSRSRARRCRAPARHGAGERHGHGAGASSDAAQAVASEQDEGRVAALSALDSVKLGDDDLITEGVNTGRDWEHEGRYMSDQSLSVTIHDPARSGTVIAAATAAGADSVNGPSFSLEQQSAAYRDALRSALAERARRPMPPPRDGRQDPRHDDDQRELGRRRAHHVRAPTPPARPPRPAPPVQDRAGDRLGAGHRDVRLRRPDRALTPRAASPARARTLASRCAARGNLVRPAAR